ncbi:MAG: hypothetical protein FJ202_00100 [Gemmatimonadetes bacterium]|nr:hypothetical protein [Gemmatimonadota bacterium]
MNRFATRMTSAALTVAFLFLPTAHAQAQGLSFFITSVGSGDGANLGGVEGADKRCQDLAAAAGAGALTWHAYLSVGAENGKPVQNAKDRIGSGPWYNAKGVKVAENVADLHSDNNKLSKENSLTEQGAVVNGRGDTPNTHDVMTGSTLDGMLFTGANYDNCNNWRSNSAGSGSVRVGHHDRQGGGENPTSWGSAHNSRGCSQDNLRASGGAGLYYCFGMPRSGGADGMDDKIRD